METHPLTTPDDVLAYGAAELALATLYRAALAVERTDVRLPDREDALEHSIAAMLRESKELRGHLARQLDELVAAPIDELDATLRRVVRDRVDAIVDPNFAEARHADRKQLDQLLERIDLGRGESVLPMDDVVHTDSSGGKEQLGQTSQALEKNQTRVTVQFNRVHCVKESKGEGTDELHVNVTLMAPGGQVATMKSLHDAGDYDTGSDHNLSWNAAEARKDPTWAPFWCILTAADLKMGDTVFGTVTLFEDDSIAPVWRDFAAVLHKLGLIALYVYVYYKTGNHGQAGASMEAADKVGRFIANEILGQTTADHLGTASFPWTLFLEKGPSGFVDVASHRYQSHYRLYFNWILEGDLALPPTPPADGTLTFKPVGTEKHAQVAVCADGTDLAWVVSAQGTVRQVSGETFTPVASGYRQVSLGSPSYIWAVDADDVAYRWQSGGFVRESEGLVEVSVGADRVAWGIRRGGKVAFYRNDPTRLGADQWEAVAGLKQISCGSSRAVWGVSDTGVVYQYHSPARGMVQRTSTPSLRQVSAASDGSVTAVDDGGGIYMWIPTTSSWMPIPANVRLQQIANAGSGLLYGLDFAGRLWRWEMPGRGKVR